MPHQRDPALFDSVADQAVSLGNRLLDERSEDEAGEIASGLVAGAIHFWLYARQPCGNPHCESCEQIATTEQRLRQLIEEARHCAEESEYYHSPYGTNVGTA